MKLTEKAFLSKLFQEIMVVLPARSLVQTAWDKREKFHPSKMFLQLNGSCPWKEHVYDIEKENQQWYLIKFVFYKDARGMFRVQAVSRGMDTFENRVSICAKFMGLRD